MRVRVEELRAVVRTSRALWWKEAVGVVQLNVNAMVLRGVCVYEEEYIGYQAATAGAPAVVAVGFVDGSGGGRDISVQPWQTRSGACRRFALYMGVWLVV